MEWFRGVPKKEGLYIRSHPPLRTIVRESLYFRNGELMVSCEESEDVPVNSQRHFRKHFLWFGPIPPVPEGVVGGI